MADQTTFDPYETFKRFYDQWEKQANDMIHLWTNNREFVALSKVGSDTQARYQEIFKKNQEFLANQLHLPTKKDVANIAKLSIQTEEKLDSLEEQIWKLQESIDSSQKEMKSMVDVSSEIIKLTKQLKTEQSRSTKELEKIKELRTDLQEMKSELAEINSLKEEIVHLKKSVGENIDKHPEQVERELELATASK
jgi:polyhydroxyalkanoic acid synthase PhaR subunit